MKYFIDQEFKEGFTKPILGKPRHFIDLISIGIVGEDGSEYYAISNEFDLKSIWNDKDEWLKFNVLKPIHEELCAAQSIHAKTYHSGLFTPFTLASMKNLIKWHGKSNKRIMGEIVCFVYKENFSAWDGFSDEFIHRGIKFGWGSDSPIEFYGYYADYDWVLFCSLFGRMLDLPNEFPKYCKDLKQMFDALILSDGTIKEKDGYATPAAIRSRKDYPKQLNEHNALDDAKWNFELYKFITHGIKV